MSGPLVARWRALEHAPVEAGARQLAVVEVENAGSAVWRTRGEEDGLFVARPAERKVLAYYAGSIAHLLRPAAAEGPAAAFAGSRA